MAEVLLTEWWELVRVVPSADHHVQLVDELAGRQVTLDREAWSMLRSISPGATVAELAEVMQIGDLELLRRIADLLGLRVIDLIPAALPPTGPAPPTAIGEPQPPHGVVAAAAAP